MKKRSYNKLTEQSLIDFLIKKKRPVKISELKKAFKLSKHKRKKLIKMLKSLNNQKIIKMRSNKVKVIGKRREFVGTITSIKDNTAILKIEHKGGTLSFRVPVETLKGAMKGDKVKAKLWSLAPLASAQISKILRRKWKYLIGKVQKKGNLYFFYPDDPEIAPYFIVVGKKKKFDIKNDDVIVCKIIEYPLKNVTGKVKIVDNLGSINNPEVDVNIVKYKYRLREEFPENVIAESKSICQNPQLPTDREDFTDKLIFTVDPENAFDFDDALSLEKINNDKFLIGVHIADVSYWVPENSFIDLEAKRRGLSIYFPEKVFPMLPKNLTQQVASLNKNEVKPAISILVTMDKNANVLSYSFHKTLIKNKYRLNYKEVDKILEDKNFAKKYPSDLVYNIKTLTNIAKKLYEKRTKKGSINFDLPEPSFEFIEKGVIENITKQYTSPSHYLVEEFMLLANEIVAKFLYFKNYPVIFRIHEPPDRIKFKYFARFTKIIGVPIDENAIDNPKYLSEYLQKLESHKLKDIISFLLLLTMKIAKYSIKPKGHYALAMDYYAHFTSPIRRYPDLIVHRILKKALKWGDFKIPTNDNLEKIANHSSERELLANYAEREVIQRKKVRFISQFIGQTFKGHIINLLPSGFVVALEKYFIDGFVSLESIKDDYYRFIPEKYIIIGKKTKKIFSLGDSVTVKLINANLWTLKIDFELVDFDKDIENFE